MATVGTELEDFRYLIVAVATEHSLRRGRWVLSAGTELCAPSTRLDPRIVVLKHVGSRRRNFIKITARSPRVKVGDRGGGRNKLFKRK